MPTIETLDQDQLLDQLANGELLEIIDLGAVSLHLVRIDNTVRVFLENPANDDQQAMICMTA